MTTESLPAARLAMLLFAIGLLAGNNPSGKRVGTKNGSKDYTSLNSLGRGLLANLTAPSLFVAQFISPPRSKLTMSNDKGQSFVPISRTGSLGSAVGLSVLTEASLSPRNTPIPPDLLSSTSESRSDGSDTSSPSVKKHFIYSPSPLSTPASRAIPQPLPPSQPAQKRRASMGKWTIVEDDLLRQVSVCACARCRSSSVCCPPAERLRASENRFHFCL